MRSCCAAPPSDGSLGDFPHHTRDSSGLPAASFVCVGRSGLIPRFLAGIGAATHRSVVTGLRLKFSAIGLIVAMLSATTGAAFAQARHPICEVREHDCGKTTRISSCCCEEAGTARDPGTPPESRRNTTDGNDAGPVIPTIEHAVPDCRPAVAVQTSPLRQHSPDLQTLFSTLLI